MLYNLWELRMFVSGGIANVQALVVRKVDNAIHWINDYPMDSMDCFANTYPLDSNLSTG